CHYVTLGLSPLAGVDGSPGRHRLLRRSLAWCYAHLGGFYHFDGLYRFKARFHPERWVPQYLISVGGPISILAFRAVLRAFAGVGLFRFGWVTLRRLVKRWLRGLGASRGSASTRAYREDSDRRCKRRAPVESASRR
ncbi:MAG: DUF2156 domain-containing protein, partial [Myxococcales bacterium]|nr:DUF2156 domain-containing protein [Myxococcales bacterium]